MEPVMAHTPDKSGPPPTARRRLWAVLGIASLLAFAGLVPVGSITPSADAATGPKTGVVCNRSSANGQSNFLLTATDGYVTVPDGNSIYMWGYADGNGAFQLPGPTLCVTEGQRVNITLVNRLSVPTSLQLPGIEDVLADGNPSAPAFDGTGRLLSLAPPVGPGGSVSYSFTADRSGTFLYESGTDPQLQVQMGLFGTLIVYPAAAAPGQADAAYAYDTSSPGPNPGDRPVYTGEPGSIYSASHEYGLTLSEVDPDLHVAVEQATGHVFTSADYTAPYHARYFMINGRSFPDTIAPNGAPWLPAQPYSALSEVQPFDPAGNPLPALLRYVSVGVTTYPFHPHSNHERVIGVDAHFLREGSADLSLEKFAIVVNPSSTQDATFAWTNVEDYEASGVPVAVPDNLNLTTGDFWNGTPYLGKTGPLNPGINQKTECGEYYHVAHSHDLTQATNYGASFGGMLTLIRVDPPDASGCG
jgi:FtsP/CotA-like multicopper oxidase with cupredoxin domain